MWCKNLMSLLFVCILCLFVGGVANAEVIYSETFDGDGTSGIDGTTPTVGTNPWASKSDFIQTDGSILGGGGNTAWSGAAYLPFDPVAGEIYTLMLDMNHTGNNPSALKYIGIGFSTTGINSQADSGHRLPSNNRGICYFLYGDSGSNITLWEKPSVEIANTGTYIGNEWVTLMIVIDATGDGSSFKVEFFLNGESITVGGPQTIERSIDDINYCAIGSYGTRNGDSPVGTMIDNFLLLEGPLTPELASSPNPEDKATDALWDVVLSWAPGEFAASHDVYFGTNFEDVNSATTASDAYKGRQELADTSFGPGRMEFGATYFWRIDEVNDAHPDKVWKGDVWQFEVEPEGLLVTQLTATASSQNSLEEDPNNTINGVGLNPDGSHSDSKYTMWLSDNTDSNVWIRYDLSEPAKLSEMLVWNYNVQSEEDLNFGIKEAQISVSVDGNNFTDLGTVTLDQAAETSVDLQGVLAKSVKITVVSNYGGSKSGLSGVRLYALPNTAREMSPADGIANVDPTTAVLSWRAGREADVHELYLSTDEQAVIDGTAPKVTLPEALYAPDLALGTTNYWRVDEVNDLEDPNVWVGSVQSLSTSAYIVVDDMEFYKSEDGKWIWETWTDGLEIASNGAILGHGADDMETAIAYGGSQSLPYYYGQDGAAVSEATLPIDAQDWSKYGIQSLSLYFHGSADNTGGQLYVKINDTKVPYEGLSDALQRAQWIPWTIDLPTVNTNIQNVTSLTIGVEGAGATGMLYIDDIRLYANVAEVLEPVIPDDGDPNLVAYYEFEGNVNDSQGNYPGTAVGDPVYTDGKIGQALSFDGVDDYIVNTFDQEVLWSAYSVSLWVKTDLFGQDVYSGLFNNNSSSADFQIEVDGSDSYLYRGSASGFFGPVSSDWVHLTVSCDGSQTQLYYNGLFVRTVNVADASFGLIAVGINRGMNNWFGGTIDDVRVYNRALSAAETMGLAGLTESVHKPF